MKILILLIVAAAVIGGGYYLVKGKSGGVSFTDSPTPSSTSEITQTPMPTPTPISLPDTVKVTMVTAKGNIELELYSKVAPKTVQNFVQLAQSKFYDGTKFHRVVADFVVQGGDPLSKLSPTELAGRQVGTGGPGYAFQDEINPKVLGVTDEMIKQLEDHGYKYDTSLKSLPVAVGAIAMANSGPNTNGSQFFIVTTKDQPHLNGLHTVFGKVTKGMDVVKKIAQDDVLKQVIIKL